MLAASKMVLDFAPEHWSSGLRLVALALADRVNQKTHAVYPSVYDLSKRTGLSERMVQKHLRQLEAEKVIVKTGQRAKKDGSMGTNVWQWKWLILIGGGELEFTRGGVMEFTPIVRERGEM